MNFNEFFEGMSERRMSIPLEGTEYKNSMLLSNEVLFQLPIISLAILMLAKDRRKPLVSEIGQLIGESIEESMPAFKGSSQHLGWSANLRVRTIGALSFLEYASLIVVSNRRGRLKITDSGKKVINRALESDSNLAYNLYQLAKAYRNICINRQLSLEIE